MRKQILFIVAIIINANCFAQGNGINEKYFQKNQLVEDLNHWFYIAEQTHPNLYAYIDKDEFLAKRNIVEKQIADSMTRKEFGRLISPLIFILNHGHAGILEAQNEFANYTKNGGLLFPFDIRVIDNRLFILNNYSDNSELAKGTEIVSVNGMLANELLDSLVQYSRGEREAFKYRFIEQEFRYKSWLVFSWGKDYELEVKIPNKTTEKVSINGIAAQQLSDRKVKTNDFKHKTINDNNAVLEIKSFQISCKKDFKKFIDESFEQINKAGIQNLVIDLRDNGGGDTRLGDYLLRYISNKPVTQFSKWEIVSTPYVKQIVKSDPLVLRILGRKHYYKPILSAKDGDVVTIDWNRWKDSFIMKRFYKPEKESKRFKGTVFVLTSDFTFSAASDFCNAIKDNKLGTIIGEETGGLATTYTDLHVFYLPNTGILAFTSIKKSYRPNGKDSGNGIIPDIEIKQTPEDFINGNDKCVDFVGKQIE